LVLIEDLSFLGFDGFRKFLTYGCRKIVLFLYNFYLKIFVNFFEEFFLSFSIKYGATLLGDFHSFFPKKVSFIFAKKIRPIFLENFLEFSLKISPLIYSKNSLSNFL
jgi:hypothetical protein